MYLTRKKLKPDFKCKMRRCWRWRCWQDMHVDLIHHQQIPVRLCAHHFRQLRRHRPRQRRARHIVLVWHGRPGRLWQAPAFKLPENRRFSNLLLDSRPRLTIKCQGEVAARDSASLSECADSAGRHTNGFTHWSGYGCTTSKRWLTLQAWNCQFDLSELKSNKSTLERLKPISSEQGDKMVKELKCAKYVECSAKSQTGLKVRIN